MSRSAAALRRRAVNSWEPSPTLVVAIALAPPVVPPARRIRVAIRACAAPTDVVCSVVVMRRSAREERTTALGLLAWMAATSQCIDLACSGTDYCQANHNGNYEWVCIDPPNGCCVFDPAPGSHCGVCGTIAVDHHTCIDPCACHSGVSCIHGECPESSHMSCNETTFCCESCVQPDIYDRCSIPNASVNHYTGCCEQFGNVPCMMYCDANVPDACGGGEICIDGCCGCVAHWGSACGNCDWGGWGTTQCDGSCYTNPVDAGCACDMNEQCGNCGTIGCDGVCNDPCPHYPGNPCGGCGTYDGDGVACNDPCNGCSPNINDSCGNCGSIQCSGSCDDPCACVPNVNSGCGGTCGTVQCDGSCYDPCAPTCVSYAGEGCGGGNCINGDCWSCGTYDCQGDCQLTPSCCAPWAGSSCGYCGTSQCDGSCSDSCAGCVWYMGYSCGDIEHYQCDGSCA